MLLLQYVALSISVHGTSYVLVIINWCRVAISKDKSTFRVPLLFCFFFLKSVVTCRLCVIFVIGTCYRSWLLGCANGSCLGDSRESLFWGMKIVFPVQLFLSGVIHFWKAEVTGSFDGCFSNMYKWCHETRFQSDAFLFWSRDPGSYRKNDRKHAVI